MRWLVFVAVLAACKDKPQQQKATPPANAPAPAKEGAPAQKPSLPAPPPNPDPVTIEDATKILPNFEGIVILPLKQTSDERQVHGTWCIDGASADGVAKIVGHLMAKAGYTALSIRGDERKAGVTGDRDGFRMSIVISASAAAVCKAPAHYFASATIFRN